MNNSIKKRFDLALKMAQKAHKNIMYYYKTDVKIQTKEGASPVVTIADQTTEQILRKMISETFPNDGILGEEFPETKSNDSEYTWTIDPIDGTLSFIYGVPLFSTMIGLIKNNEAIMGIIHFPVLNETIYAIKGQGTYYSSFRKTKFEPTHVSKTSQLSEALFCHSGLNYFEDTDSMPLFKKIHSKVKYSRSWGDAFGHMMVAKGDADIMIDSTLSIWDIVPIKVIIEEAGGYFCDINGKNNIYSTSGVSTNKQLANDVLKLL